MMVSLISYTHSVDDLSVAARVQLSAAQVLED